MKILYIIGGVALLAYGIWQTIATTKIFIAGRQDKLGADIKILGAGIISIIGGIILISKYI